MDEAILDTDILSEVLKKKNQHVLAAADQYLREYSRLGFSAMTLYEIVRGMRAGGASRQLNSFLALARTSDVFPISLEILMRASELWTNGRSGGHPHDDADLIIAATALETERVLVTGNTSHFDWIDGLRLIDWRHVSP
ncbi:MAG: type II toxin-antitoxin system VapC family toxin [Planctomycetaceae bacterium]